MMEAAQFVEIIERRQGYKKACLEEIAWRQTWSSDENVLEKADELNKNGYGEYLRSLIEQGRECWVPFRYRDHRPGRSCTTKEETGSITKEEGGRSENRRIHRRSDSSAREAACSITMESENSV